MEKLLGQIDGLSRRQCDDLHALRDIREHRARDQRPQHRGPQRDRDFTVVRRGQRRPIPMSLTPAARSGS